MGKKWIWLTLGLGVIILVAIVAALQLMAQDPWQTKPAAMQILEGKPGVYSSHLGKLLNSVNGTSLEPGNFVATEQNSSAVLQYFDGSAIKIDEKTEVQHLWSRSRKQQPNLVSQGKFYLNQLMRRLSGRDAATEPEGTGRSIGLEVLYGKIAVSATRQTAPGAH